MEEILYTGWKAHRWWCQVLEESSQWGTLLIFLRPSYLLLWILILDWFFTCFCFYPYICTVLKIWFLIYLMQGVDPSLRTEVWPFLLGVYAFPSLYLSILMFVCVCGLYLHVHFVYLSLWLGIEIDFVTLLRCFCCIVSHNPDFAALLRSFGCIVNHNPQVNSVPWIAWAMADC